jgi:hypothetical protein
MLGSIMTRLDAAIDAAAPPQEAEAPPPAP